MIDHGALGSIGIDDLVFPDGSTMFGVPGGGAVYSALGMAVWGARPTVVAPVGPDYPLADLAPRLDMDHCPRIDRTMRNWGLYEANGHRTFVLHSTVRDYRTFCASPRDLGGRAFRHCHVAPAPWDMQLDLVAELRAAGAETISVDPDDVSLASMPMERLKDLLGGCDLFLPSQLDVSNMMPGVDAAACIKALRDLVPGVPVIAVKQGERGVTVHAAGWDHLVVVPTAAREVVDVTGAGDAFSGGALMGFGGSRDPVEAILKASVSASFALATHGPGGLLSAAPAEARARLAQLRDRVTTIPL